MSTPSPAEIEAGLTNFDENSRADWARRVPWHLLSADQIERGLNDKNLLVRLAWLERSDIRLTPQQVHRLMRDPSGTVRAAVARCPGWGPPKAPQIAAGLSDEDQLVRESWALRTDWGPPSSEQVEHGLTDPHALVRTAWAERADWGPPSPEQAERGLADAHPWVRQAWAQRLDFKPTLQQIERGLADPDERVCKAWQERLAQEAQNDLLDLEHPSS